MITVSSGVLRGKSINGFVNRWSGVQTPSGAPLNLFLMKKLHQNEHYSEQNSGLMIQYSQSLIDDFRKYLTIDHQLTHRTAYSHINLLTHFLERFDEIEVNKSEIQEYLVEFKNKNTYRNVLSMLKVFLRDFMKRPDLIEGFKFPRVILSPKSIPSKEELRRFYESIEDQQERTLFLLFASSGLRRHELLNIKKEEVDSAKRMLTPKSNGQTKLTWVTFYNHEAEKELEKHSESGKEQGHKLFLNSERVSKKIWSTAREITGLDITPKILREWFAEEMSNLGVSDRYIDAFCGRIPRSVLARHYTDYRPDKLKIIYDKANLKVLS